MSVENEGGVPVVEATASDFMMVRAALVQRLGGANEALVWTRIDYRVQAKTPPHVDEDGIAWWPATQDDLAEETGLSPDQAKRAIASLLTGGYIAKEQHHLGGNYDRTNSYRTVVHGRPIDQADSPNESGRNRPMEQAESPNVPLSQTYRKKREGGAPRDRGSRIPDPFVVTTSMWEWAAERCPLVDARRSTEMFVNYWRAKTGKDATKRDWLGTWRNWLLKDQADAERRQPHARTFAQQKQDNNLSLLERYTNEGKTDAEIRSGAAAGVRGLTAGA